MRQFGLVSLVLSAGFLCFAQPVCSIAQTSDPKAQSDQAETLRVAPNAPRSAPEVLSGNADGGKADICQELVAFVQKASDETLKADPPRNAATQPQSTQGPINNSSQDTSQRQSGVSASVPRDDAAKAPAAMLSLEKAQTLAEAHDLRGCQRAAQQMRREGVALPPGLLALAALREDLLR